MKTLYAVLLLLLLPTLLKLSIVQATSQLEYRIEIHTDGSAKWIVEQRGTDVSTSPQSFEKFMNNVSLLLSLARKETSRNMTCDPNSFSMNVSISGSYKIVRYQFIWKGFAELKNTKITIGDVFYVEHFFSYFYGDGAVYITYPSEYIVEYVSPPPNRELVGTLEWYGILDFKAGEPKVVLEEKNAPQNFADIVNKNIVLIAGAVTLIGGTLVLFYYFKVRIATRKDISKPELPVIPEMEDDEMKIINLLKAAGGSLYQSIIADKCGFSRSKTSKLLKIMEKKGTIKRKEKGREKVVTLTDENK